MRELKAEWWELWWVKDGERPVCIPMYGESIPHWIPPHGYPSKQDALEARNYATIRDCTLLKIIHVKRYAKKKLAKPTMRGNIKQ